MRIINGNQNFLLILLIAAFVRIVLVLFRFDEVFGNRKEIVTPVTDFKRVVEGLYLLESLGHSSPYLGDVYHQSPLIIALFYPLQNHTTVTKLFFLAIDLIIAGLLKEITELWQRKNMGQQKTQDQKSLLMKNLPVLTAAMYLFNPFTIFSCLGMSTTAISNLAVILSMYFVLKGNLPLATFCLAIASHLSIYPVILIFPLSLLMPHKPLLFVLLLFGFFSTALLGLSYLVFHSWEFLYECYGFTFLVSDLTPNIGLFWYYFMEVFVHFRNFYLFVYQYNVFVYSIPLYFRLHQHPLFLFWVNLAIIAVFKSYPAVGDIALQMALLPIIFDDIKGTQYGFIVSIVALFSIVLAPIFWLMWIYQGTGNANFYYAINLVLTVAQIMFIVDAISSVLKEDYMRKKQVKEQPPETQLIQVAD